MLKIKSQVIYKKFELNTKNIKSWYNKNLKLLFFRLFNILYLIKKKFIS